MVLVEGAEWEDTIGDWRNGNSRTAINTQAQYFKNRIQNITTLNKRKILGICVGGGTHPGKSLP